MTARRGLVNGDEAAILAIGYRFVTLETDGGRTLSLHRDDPQLRHLDHAWSATLHAAQGTTHDNVNRWCWSRATACPWTGRGSMSGSAGRVTARCC